MGRAPVQAAGVALAWWATAARRGSHPGGSEGETCCCAAGPVAVTVEVVAGGVGFAEKQPDIRRATARKASQRTASQPHRALSGEGRESAPTPAP
jgi:hypothetical protein